MAQLLARGVDAGERHECSTRLVDAKESLQPFVDTEAENDIAGGRAVEATVVGDRGKRDWCTAVQWYLHEAAPALDERDPFPIGREHGRTPCPVGAGDLAGRELVKTSDVVRSTVSRPRRSGEHDRLSVRREHAWSDRAIGVERDLRTDGERVAGALAEACRERRGDAGEHQCGGAEPEHEWVTPSRAPNVEGGPRHGWRRLTRECRRELGGGSV